METIRATGSRPRRGRRILATLVILPLLVVTAVWMSVTPGWELRRLRHVLDAGAAPGDPMPIQVGIGSVGRLIAKGILRWTPAPPEIQTVLGAVRRAEVSVREHGGWRPGLRPADQLERAARHLAAGQWTSQVRVEEPGRAVGVFLRPDTRPDTWDVCVVVLEEERTVLVRATAQPDRLLPLAGRFHTPARLSRAPLPAEPMWTALAK